MLAVLDVPFGSLPPAQHGGAVLASQAFKNNSDFLLDAVMPAGRPVDIFDDPIGGSFPFAGFPLFFHSRTDYGEPGVNVQRLTRDF